MNLIIGILLLGTASQYAPGVMQSVIAVRQSGRTAYSLPTELPIVDGYMAVLECHLIGSLVDVVVDGSVEVFLITDCAGVNDGGRDWMVRNGIIAEVDHLSAVRWNSIGVGKKIGIQRLYSSSRLEVLCD